MTARAATRLDAEAVLALLAAVDRAADPEAVYAACVDGLGAEGLPVAIVGPDGATLRAAPDAAGPATWAAALADDATLELRADGPVDPGLSSDLRQLAVAVAARLGGLRLFRRVEGAKREWESTFDAIEDGIAVVAPDGVVRRANRALAGLLGLDVRDLPGRTCCELLPHHADEGCPVRSGASGATQFEVFVPDYRCWDESVHRRASDGTVILVLRDVTERRLVAERMAKLHEEAKRSNRALTRSLAELRAARDRAGQADAMASLAALAAGLAHEINNPLGFVRANVEHLGRQARRLLGALDRLAALAPPDRAEEARAALAGAEAADLREDLDTAVADALEGADRIARIVAAIAEFTAGDGAEAGPVSLEPLVQEALADARERHGAAARLALGPLAEAPVLGRRRPIFQALSRLLDNALEAGGDAPVEVEAREDGDRVVLEVRDRGRGVAPAVADRILDPFFTTHPVGSHLGLGLTIAAALAARHGGTLAVAPREDGPGTVARLALPRAEPPAA